MEVVDVDEAGRRLGVSARRVRQLLDDGRLHGSRVGRSWAIDPASVERLGDSGRPIGRPWRPASAWAVLKLAAGDEPDVSPVEHSRARRRLRQHSLVGLAERLGPRASVHRLGAHSAAIDRLAADPRVVRSGVSAAGDHDVDLVNDGSFEGYAPKEAFDDLCERYALDPAAERPNVVVRVVDDHDWPFAPDQHVAPWPVVAVDLLEADDERSRRAGRLLMEQHS